MQPTVFEGIGSFKWLTSENGIMHIMFGKKSTLGFNSQVFGVLAEGDLNGLVLKGNVVWGKRNKGKWEELNRSALT